MFHVKPMIVRPLPGDEKTTAKFTNSTRYRIDPSPFSVHPVGSKEYRIRVAADRHHCRRGTNNTCDTSEYRGQSTRARPGPSVSRETPSIAHSSIRHSREIQSPQTAGPDTELVVGTTPDLDGKGKKGKWAGECIRVRAAVPCGLIAMYRR